MVERLKIRPAILPEYALEVVMTANNVKMKIQLNPFSHFDLSVHLRIRQNSVSCKGPSHGLHQFVSSSPQFHIVTQVTQLYEPTKSSHIQYHNNCSQLLQLQLVLSYQNNTGWLTVLSVEPMVQYVVCLSVCNVLYCVKTVRFSQKVSEGVNRKPGSKSSFFGRRHISTSGFVRSATASFSWVSCFKIAPVPECVSKTTRKPS